MPAITSAENSKKGKQNKKSQAEKISKLEDYLGEEIPTLLNEKLGKEKIGNGIRIEVPIFTSKR